MTSRKHFTYLWTNASWERKKALAGEGYRHLDYAAGSRFRAAGIEPGSVVFIVTVIKGSVFVGGYIEVADLLDRAGAARFLGVHRDELRVAKEYIVARRGAEQSFRGDLRLANAVAKNLVYLTPSNTQVHPRLDRDGRIDRQTLRNARRLAPGSEQPLFDLLAR